MRKRQSTDFASLETIINKAIDQHLDMKIDHEIVSHDYIAQTAAYCDQSQKNVITDFSTEQTDKIFQSCDLLSCSMSTQAIVITFKFKIEYDKQKFKTKKKQAAVTVITAAVTVTDVIADLLEISEQSTVLNSQCHASELLECINICLKN